MTTPTPESGNPLFSKRESLRKHNIFGSAKWKKHFKSELRGGNVKEISREHAGRAFEKRARMPYKDAIRFVEENYALDPREPENEFAKNLRDRIAKKLHLQTKEEKHRLKIYSTDESPLEEHYGIDALVVYIDPEAGPIFVSLDESHRRVGVQDREGEYRDLLMHEEDLERGDAEKIKLSLEKWSKEAARVIEEKHTALLEKNDEN